MVAMPRAWRSEGPSLRLIRIGRRPVDRSQYNGNRPVIFHEIHFDVTRANPVSKRNTPRATTGRKKENAPARVLMNPTCRFRIVMVANRGCLFSAGQVLAQVHAVPAPGLDLRPAGVQMSARSVVRSALYFAQPECRVVPVRPELLGASAPPA